MKEELEKELARLSELIKKYESEKSTAESMLRVHRANARNIEKVLAGIDKQDEGKEED